MTTTPSLREQKYEANFAKWMSPANVKFAGPEVEAAYKERVQMLKDVVELKKPSRLPICLNIGFYPQAYAGISAKDAMYDYEKMGMAWKKYHRDFMPDSMASAMMPTPAKLFNILDYKLYRYPGHGAPDDVPYQCVEDEFMRADEYDAFIRDPSGFWMRQYLPRIMGSLAPWSSFSPFTDLVEILSVGPFMIPMGLPPVQESFKKLMEAGNAALEWAGAFGAVDAEVTATCGLPATLGGFTKAPFDTLGDTLRGTKGIMLDIYRQPAKLLKALDALVPIAIDMGVRACSGVGNPMCFIPLHKGADGFLSRDSFKKFYWPTLKTVMNGLIEEGLVPWVFVEGAYNQRLDFLADPDLPKGKIVWIFDSTDMVKVKETLGGIACFGGNVPVSMLKVGTPEEVRTYVKDLFDKVGRDGGFILSTGGVVDDAKPENMHALIDAGREFGKY